MTTAPSLPRFLCASFLLGLTCCGWSAAAEAANVKIAIVHMQQVLNRYEQTQVEVQALNDLMADHKKQADEEKARLKQLSDELLGLQNTAADSALAETRRKEAATAFQKKFGERQALIQKIQDLESDASEAVTKERANMEMRLVSVIDKMIETIAEEQQIDIVWDSSFLPKANKAIKYTSSRVKDLTEKIIERLNE